MYGQYSTFLSGCYDREEGRGGEDEDRKYGMVQFKFMLPEMSILQI